MTPRRTFRSGRVPRPRASFLLLLPILAGLGACSDDAPPPAVGTLERDRLDLVAEVSEPVIARPIEEGSRVEAGDLLVRLDPTRLRARVTQAEEARDRARARVDELVRGPRQERIAEGRAQLAATEGRLVTARRNLERTEELFESGVASREQVDQQRALHDEAKGARDAAAATLEALVEGTTAEELTQVRAGLAEARAALEEVEVQLGRLEVRAPSAGWLEALPFELGEQPPPGGVVAVLLVDEAPYARVYVPEVVRARVKAGTGARVHVDGFDEPLRGRVRTVARDASFTPYFALTERDRGRLVYLAKIDLVGPEARELPTGIPVHVEFDLEDASLEATGVSPRG